ncbi:hypothetical protein J4H92_02740 [Leucobacter weissii]|uniref:Uncharacterized protein n=1 Tax=Leucobacter weissii TaxID=1983706 RepID=A0A939S519_9MICO|nr:hypothetical protein [Leucobacter weissii]MBO1900864.1 hypothetical protein [Leucobacter weissii]
MGIRGVLRRVNDPSSVPHGVVSTALVAGLALVEPRRLTTGRRLVYRVGIAAMTAWMVWASLRPKSDETVDSAGPVPLLGPVDPAASFGSLGPADPLGPLGRAAVATGAAGAALGIAEAGEALDARLHDGLVRAGARRPRLWLAAGEAALSIAAWWAARRLDRVSIDTEYAFEEPARALVELPGELRDLALHVLSATEDHGAPRLREQLAAARAISFDDGAIEISFAQFDTPTDLPRAVPGNGVFPVIGRFRALDSRTFDIRIFVDEGRLESIHIDEGADWTPEERDDWDDAGRDVGELEAWPAPADVELLSETESGYRPLT